MKDLPEYLTVPLALSLIATRNVALCQNAFGAVGAEVAAPVHLGLDRAAWVIALDRQPELLALLEKMPDGKSPRGNVVATIKGKFVEMDVLENGGTPCRGRPADSAKSDYVFFQPERELIDALASKKILAYTVGADNDVRVIDPALWLGREFDQEVGEGGHLDVVAITTGKMPLRHIRVKRDDVLCVWRPEGGRKRGTKSSGANYKDDWCRMALEILEKGGARRKYGVKIAIARRLREKGYNHYSPNTIAGYISRTVDEWETKHRAT